MISSGMKRGLAATAISAMSVSGLPFLAPSASAVSLATSGADANSVIIATPDTATVSTKNDGQNTTVRLETVGGANVTSVKYEYSLGGAFTTIATVTRNDNGAFAHEWAPTGLDGATGVTVKATGLAADGTTVIASDTQGVAINATDPSVNVNDGATVGVFQKPDYDVGGLDTAANNVILSGTSSSPTGAPATKFWDDDTDGASAGNQAGWSTTSGTTTSTTAAGAATGTWSGVLDITGYNFGATDELLVKATDTTDDSEAYSLYKQTITTVTATADRTQVPVGQTAAITVTVKDQNGNPIAGAEVRADDNTLIGQTNRKGEVSTTQGAGTHYYFANNTASDSFEPEVGDKRSDSITVTQYAPAPTKLVASSNDGPAFDTQEYAAGDITVQVQDQNSNNFDTAGQTLQYYWVVTPFVGGTPIRVPATGTTPQPAELGGKYVVTFPAGQPDGTYELFASLDADPLGNGAIASSKVLTVKEGNSDIAYDQASREQAAAGTSEVVGAKLTLADGTGLGGRQVTMTWTIATGGTDSTPDAGIVQANGTIGASRSVRTGADGSFSVTVKDPAETPQGTETGGVLNGSTDDTDFGFDNNADNDGNATESAPANHGVDFLASLTPASVVISNQDAGLESPGEVEPFTATVMSGDQDPNTVGVQAVPLSNQSVSVSTDHGYFTDGTPVVTAGGDQGVFDNDGQTKTVTTDTTGVATFKISMGRDAGFDDDGDVTSHMSATAGSVSDTQDQDWTSETPLNGGAVDLHFSPAAQQQSGVLPKAPISDIVWFDVFTTDQFGNRVGGETVTLTDNTGQAGLSSAVITTDYTNDGDFTATSVAAVDQKVTASWTAPTHTYNNATPPAPAAGAGTENLTDDLTVNWYTVDFAHSTFTLTHSGADLRPVGTTVTETYKAVDQFGEPISDLFVEFFRSGPDNLQDGEGNFDGMTGQDGSIQYVFQGAKAGTATITAIGRNGGPTGDVVAAAQRTDVVRFGLMPIQAILTGNNNGARADRLTVDAPAQARGAVVRLYKVVNGVRRLVGKSTLNLSGNRTFRVADRNGRAYTKYVAVVSKTARTKADTTNTKRVR
jgi:hypothetical protein